ncbi:hypothetical protein MHYP_G00251120 [Metynnis hypsauchen]
MLSSCVVVFDVSVQSKLQVKSAGNPLVFPKDRPLLNSAERVTVVLGSKLESEVLLKCSEDGEVGSQLLGSAGCVYLPLPGAKYKQKLKTSGTSEEKHTERF